MLNIESMVDGLSQNGWYAQEDVLDSEAVEALKNDLATREYKNAGVGELKSVQQQIRNDKIYWVEPDDVSPVVQSYIKMLDNIKENLNQSMFLGVRSHEMHFAQYDAGGFYRPHYDNFKGRNKRVVTAITYLNKDWKPDNGGCLQLHLNDDIVKIAPKAGTFAVFLSEKILHEVTESFAQRQSMTGWFLRDSI